MLSYVKMLSAVIGLATIASGCRDRTSSDVKADAVVVTDDTKSTVFRGCFQAGFPKGMKQTYFNIPGGLRAPLPKYNFTATITAPSWFDFRCTRGKEIPKNITMHLDLQKVGDKEEKFRVTYFDGDLTPLTMDITFPVQVAYDTPAPSETCDYSSTDAGGKSVRLLHGIVDGKSIMSFYEIFPYVPNRPSPILLYEFCF